MTSGNVGGEPIAYRDEDAAIRLAPLVDAWLRHDRPIQVPVDGSVSRVVDGREAPVRRSRPPAGGDQRQRSGERGRDGARSRRCPAWR